MNRVRVTDSAAVPSPAVAGTDHSPHSHPLPRSMRILLVVYGLVLGLTFTSAGVLYVGQRHRDAQQVARVAAEVQRQVDQVAARLDARTRMRDEQAAHQADLNALQAKQTIELACEVIAGDIAPSSRTRALANRLHCPLAP